MEDLKNQIESLLFASGKFMSEENLSLIIGVEKKDVKKAIKLLKTEYDQRDHSLLITQEADTWKINVREKYLELVRKIVADTELPKSVLETLAVIAWKSPSVQSEIVKVRGNKCYEHIAQLEEMGFVTKDPEGRSFILKVTEKFFEYFDVEGDKNLKELFKDVKAPEKNPQQILEQTADTDISEIQPQDDEILQENKEDALEEAEEEKELNAEVAEDVLEETAETGTVVEGKALNEAEATLLKEAEKSVNAKK